MKGDYNNGNQINYDDDDDDDDDDDHSSSSSSNNNNTNNAMKTDQQRNLQQHRDTQRAWLGGLPNIISSDSRKQRPVLEYHRPSAARSLEWAGLRTAVMAASATRQPGTDINALFGTMPKAPLKLLQLSRAPRVILFAASKRSIPREYTP